MPDLHLDAVHAFWDSYDRRTLYRVLVALERVEYWTQDRDPDINAAIIELGNAMDGGVEVEVGPIAKLFVKLISNTNSARAMRIMQTLDINKPGSASQLLMYAEENNPKAAAAAGNEGDPDAQLFLDRNMVFERLQLLSRIFSPQRISLVLKSLEYHHEMD